MATKFVFVTGGVVSSLGKGITAASLGRLLKALGYKVSMQKCDPYYNVDPGLLSPLQHGEAFVTDDGVAADLDLGHYERFIDENLRGEASITTGKVHKSIMERELRGEYRGGTVQVIPHVTNEIKSRILSAARNSGADIAIIEIGGTVGDMDSSPYKEAIRQLKWDLGEHDNCFIHENVTSLRRMGTYSFFIALITSCRLFLYLTPAVIVVILVFVIAGLFSKVLSQVFDKAVTYKEENDLTI